MHLCQMHFCLSPSTQTLKHVELLAGKTMHSLQHTATNYTTLQRTDDSPYTRVKPTFNQVCEYLLCSGMRWENWCSVLQCVAVCCKECLLEWCARMRLHTPDWTLQDSQRHCKNSEHTHRTGTHCNTLQHTTIPCNTLQYLATKCSKSQQWIEYDAIHCNTLEHTGTCYNTLETVTRSILLASNVSSDVSGGHPRPPPQRTAAIRAH